MKKIILTLPIILSSLLISGCSDDTSEEVVQQEAPKVIVSVAEVERGDAPVYIHAVGSVKATESVQIIARTGGELLEVHVSEGDYVEAGDILFSLDKEPLELGLQAANAGLQSNTIQLKKAEDDLERVKKLAETGSVSTDQIEQVTAQVNLLQTAILVDRVNIKNANLNLSYADITAPISGRVGSINTDKGNLVSPGQPVLTSIDSVETMEVTFYVPEKHLSALIASEDDEVVPVHAITSDGVDVEGRLTFIGNIAPATGTIMLKASFDNKDSKLWVGQFVDITVTVDVLEDVLIVPEKAVALGPDGPMVYVIDNDEAELELVEIALEEGGYTVLSSGVQEKDNVVVDGHVRLYDGAKVTIVDMD